MVSIRRNIPIKVHFLVKASSMLNLYGYRMDCKRSSLQRRLADVRSEPGNAMNAGKMPPCRSGRLAAPILQLPVALVTTSGSRRDVQQGLTSLTQPWYFVI